MARARFPRSAIEALAVFSGLAAFVWSCDGPADPEASEARGAAVQRAVLDAPSVSGAGEGKTGEPQILRAGETAVISLASRPPGRSVPVALALAADPSADPAPLPVRVISGTGALLELDAVVAADRATATLDLPRSFLEPGRYLIEVRTTEKSHFPLRRYVVEVKDADGTLLP